MSRMKIARSCWCQTPEAPGEVKTQSYNPWTEEWPLVRDRDECLSGAPRGAHILTPYGASRASYIPSPSSFAKLPCRYPEAVTLPKAKALHPKAINKLAQDIIRLAVTIIREGPPLQSKARESWAGKETPSTEVLWDNRVSQALLGSHPALVPLTPQCNNREMVQKGLARPPG